MNARVLFVDDDQRMLNSLRATFGARYEISACLSADEASLLMARKEFDVLVCDQRMPGTKGLEFLSEAKHRWPNTARVLMAGHIDESQLAKDLARADLYRLVPKPFDAESLGQTIDEAYTFSKQRVDSQGAQTNRDLEEVVEQAATPETKQSAVGERCKEPVFPERTAAIGDVKRIGDMLGTSAKPSEAFKSLSVFLSKSETQLDPLLVLIDLYSATAAIGQWLDLLQSKCPSLVVIAVGAPPSPAIADTLASHKNVYRTINSPMEEAEARSVIRDALNN